MAEFSPEKLRQLTIVVGEDQTGPEFTFNYYPPTWSYREGDFVQFVCNKGPFSVTYVPFDKDNGQDLPRTVSPFGKFGGVGPLILEVPGNEIAQPGTGLERFSTKPKEVEKPGPEGQAKLAKDNNNNIEFFRYQIKIGGVDATPEGNTPNGGWCG